MDIAQNRELIYNISSRGFEEVIERLFQDEGFETKLKQPTRDRGRDIIAMKYEMGNSIVFYIECKKKDGVELNLLTESTNQFW